MRAFALTDMVKWGYDRLRGVAPYITEGDMRGIPAIHRAARLRAEAIASLRLRCFSGEGVDKRRRDSVWQAQLFASEQPNYYQTRFGFWETVEESLAYRNNAYIWKNTDPLTMRVIELWALHPDQVDCLGAGSYRVKIQDGYLDPVGRGNGQFIVSEDTILHIRGHGQGGTLEAPTPIQVFRSALAGPVGRQSYEEKVWAKGAALQVAVQFPPGTKKQESDQWKDEVRDKYSGAGGDSLIVVGGGAEVKPIGMTLADALFVDMAKLTVMDASRIMGVPANLLGAQLDRAVPNLEQDLATWLRFGLGPECERIESALAADDELFPVGAQTYPQFDTDQFVRGDVQTEDNVAHQQVQDGRLLVDEWRASQGLPPLPGGAGKIPQVVPVGGGPNPNGNQNGNGNGATPVAA